MHESARLALSRESEAEIPSVASEWAEKVKSSTGLPSYRTLDGTALKWKASLLLDLLQLAGWDSVLLSSQPFVSSFMREVYRGALPADQACLALRLLQDTMWQHLLNRPFLQDQNGDQEVSRVFTSCFDALEQACR